MTTTTPAPGCPYEDNRWEAHLREHEEHDKTHGGEHRFESETIRLREAAITSASMAHEKEHDAQEEAINKALAGVDRLADVHAEAHKREHFAHEQRHEDQQVAVGKAEASVDKRLEAMNEFRAQLRDQQQTFATSRALGAMQETINQRLDLNTKHTDERYEENRRRIEALEKSDVKTEGKSLGQGTVVAMIVGGIGFIVTFLGLIILVANILTGNAA